MNILCNLDLHDWSKWSKPRPEIVRLESPLFRYTGEPEEGHSQYRTCLRCGKSDTELRTGPVPGVDKRLEV